MAIAPLHFAGNSNPLTVITPLKKWKSLFTIVLLRILSRWKLTTARQLEFIHYARWLVLRGASLPRLSEEQEPEKTERDYYIFATNFNGPWDQYIDTFALVPDVRRGMWWLWLTSETFPGPWPIRAFKRYIHYHTYPLDLYYNAYPVTTVRGISAALSVQTALQAFLEDTREEDDPQRFAERYRAFEREIVDDLGSAGDSRPPSLRFQRPQSVQL